jgi:PPP family 3-phenylpropionic acid transporter
VIALRLVVLSLGVALGVFYPFLSVILADRGFGPGEIGLIASVGAVGFTIAVPAWGHLADVRLGRPRTLQVCGVGAAIAVGLLWLPWPPVMIGVLLAAFWIFESSWQPLADAITVNTVRGRDYARIRLLTSFSFAVAAIGAGFAYDRTGYSPAYAAFAGFAIVMAVAAAWVPDVGRADLAAHAPGRTRTWRFGSSGVALRVAPRLGLVLVAVTLLHVGVISGFTFLGLRIVELGGAPSDVALAAGLSAAAEIPGMLIAGRVARRIGLRWLFVACALLYAGCLASWTVVDVPALIIATRLITGMAFAGVIVGVVLTIAALLPPELQATGQALYQTTAFGIGAIVANVVGGALYATIGPAATFGLGAILAVVAAAVGVVAFPARDARGGAPGQAGDVRRSAA